MRLPLASLEGRKWFEFTPSLLSRPPSFTSRKNGGRLRLADLMPARTVSNIAPFDRGIPLRIISLAESVLLPPSGVALVRHSDRCGFQTFDRGPCIPLPPLF